MIRKKVKEYFCGKMVENIQEHGIMENNKEQEYIIQKWMNIRSENGQMEKDLNGQNKKRLMIV